VRVSGVDLFVVDLDGTIADTRDDIARSVNFVLASEGRPPMSTGEVWRCVGEGVATLMERVFGVSDGNAAWSLAVGRSNESREASNPDRVRLRERVETFRAHYAEHLLDATRLYDGVAAFLARVRCAVLTNKPEAMSRRIVDGLGVGERVEAILGGDSLPTRKPDPAGLVEILARCTGAPARALFVGDSVVDAETARAGAVRFVGVSYGYSTRPELIAAGAIGVVDSLMEIEA
jgi:phosphoglycolate phosphatase